MAQHQSIHHKRLAVAGALLLSLTSGFAHADAFSSGVNSQEVTAMRQRMDTLEQQLATVKDQQEKAKAEALAAQKPAGAIGPDGQPIPERPGLPSVARAADLDPLAEPPYLVLGTINGHYLVKHGDKRHLLTPGELETFEAKELLKARARMSIGETVGNAVEAGVNAISKLPAPPPLNTLAAKTDASHQTKAATTPPAPAAKPGSRAAQRATNSK